MRSVSGPVGAPTYWYNTLGQRVKKIGQSLRCLRISATEKAIVERFKSNDISPEKAACYRANYGDEHFRLPATKWY